MASKANGRPKKMRRDDILSFIREHEDPVVTSAEVADEFGASRRGAYERLSKLEKEDKIRSKTVGSSAKVWYLIG